MGYGSVHNICCHVFYEICDYLWLLLYIKQHPLNKLTNQNLDLQHWTATGGNQKKYLLAWLLLLPRTACSVSVLGVHPYPLVIYLSPSLFSFQVTSRPIHSPDERKLSQINHCDWKSQKSHADRSRSPRYLWWEASFLLHWGYTYITMSCLFFPPLIGTKSNWTLHKHCTESMHQPKKKNILAFCSFL